MHFDVIRSSSTTWDAIDRETGEKVVSARKDPEHALARELLSRGITGTFRTYFPGSDVARMVVNIEKAALRSVSEGDRDGLSNRVYRPVEIGE